MFRSHPENVWHAEYKLALPSACHTLRSLPEGPRTWGALEKERECLGGKVSFSGTRGQWEITPELASLLDFPEEGWGHGWM